MGTRVLLDRTFDPLDTVERALLLHEPEAVLEMVKESGLRGRGGAGFPAGLKWQAVAGSGSPDRFLIANGAEGEPGSLKDRFLMEHRPDLVVGGLILAAWATGARKAYLYVHHGAEEARLSLAEAVSRAGERGLLSRVGLEVEVVSASIGYVAGEETAVIQSIEGKPALPQVKPPYPTAKGLFGCPTVVNNIETLAHVPGIVERGPEWFRSLGTEDTPGTLLLTLNGVKHPGVYEFRAGTRLIDAISAAGGARGKIKAVLPGGYSSGFLGYGDLDVPLEYSALRERGSFLGCGAVHVFESGECMVEVTRRISHFFAAETCGQCFPCRRGTRNFLRSMLEAERGYANGEWKKGLDESLALALRKTICGLVSVAAKPVRTALELFPKEFSLHLDEKRVACALCSGKEA